MPEESPVPQPPAEEPPTGGPPAASSPEGAPSGNDGKPPESSASLVAGGILSSRLTGLLRVSAEAYFLGVGAHADIFQAAVKVPNLLQNLLGEGTLSAAFIPIYSRMLDEGRREEAGRFAGAVFGLLLAVAAGVALLGILLAEPITALLAPGFTDDAARVAAGELAVNRFELTVRAVRIVFPATALLVFSAWALGILNSHRRFFLPYFAPVLTNVAIIAGFAAAAFVFADGPLTEGDGSFAASTQTRLLFGALIGVLAGGALQFLVQLPLVSRVMKGFKLSLSTRVEGVREALRAFGPVVLGRGVYQLSAYLDIFLASWLAAGALGSLRYAQILYILPVSLFGLSVAASELPELSRISSEKMRAFLRRLDKSLNQMLFLTIPTLVGYLGLGLLLVEALFRRGSFGLNDAWLVYVVLCGYSLGLIATAASRLLQNAFYALGDTKTPAKIAVARVSVSAAVAVPLMLLLDTYSVSVVLGFEAQDTPLFFGAVGLALGATAGAWVELWQLLRALHRRSTAFQLSWDRTVQMAGLAVVALAPAALLWWLLPNWPSLLMALLVVGAYALFYLAVAQQAGFPEVRAWTGRFLDRFRS